MPWGMAGRHLCVFEEAKLACKVLCEGNQGIPLASALERDLWNDLLPEPYLGVALE